MTTQDCSICANTGKAYGKPCMHDAAALEGSQVHPESAMPSQPCASQQQAGAAGVSERDDDDLKHSLRALLLDNSAMQPQKVRNLVDVMMSFIRCHYATPAAQAAPHYEPKCPGCWGRGRDGRIVCGQCKGKGKIPDRRRRSSHAAQSAPAVASAEQVRKAARWDFMMRITDNDRGPEARAMERFDQIIDKTKPESEQMIEVIDKAIAFVRSTTPGAPSTEQGGAS